MRSSTRSPDAIIIGAGPSGISMAYTLKHQLRFTDFTIYEKLDGVGGTWRTNKYPGVGCDVPTHLYSFHFNLNPNWSKELCDGPEILNYMESTVDKFELRSHMHFHVECLGAAWNVDSNQWDVRFRDLQTGIEYTRSVTVLLSAVGGISYPRDVKFPGMEQFQGEMFHTARWNHDYDYSGKRMAVIGNGCSAAQVVPNVVDKVSYIKQYARSAQWYHERPNRDFTSFQKWCFKWLPLWMRYHRLALFLENDDLVATYGSTAIAAKKRGAAENAAKQYIYKMAPEKYHGFIVPEFPLGCKRRIFDPNYLEALHSENLDLVAEGIKEIDESGITSTNGERTEFDVIVLATGFQVQQFLTPMEIVGRNGISLNQQWSENRGAQAYFGTYVHNFPNFGILFGPNTFPAHNSALFSCEVQVSYVAKTLFPPLLDERAKIVEVKRTAEDLWVNNIQHELSGSVFESGCSNWYINEFGRNAASWPGYASTFWKSTMWPRYRDFEYTGGDKWWLLRRLWRRAKFALKGRYSMIVVVLGGMAMIRNRGLIPRDFGAGLEGSMRSMIR